MDFAIKTHGKLDSLIVNHGVLKPMTTVAKASVEEWKQAYDVNLFSALALVRCGAESHPNPQRLSLHIGTYIGQRGDSTPPQHKGQHNFHLIRCGNDRLHVVGRVRILKGSASLARRARGRRGARHNQHQRHAGPSRHRHAADAARARPRRHEGRRICQLRGRL